MQQKRHIVVVSSLNRLGNLFFLTFLVVTIPIPPETKDHIIVIFVIFESIFKLCLKPVMATKLCHTPSVAGPLRTFTKRF